MKTALIVVDMQRDFMDSGVTVKDSNSCCPWTSTLPAGSLPVPR